MTPENDLRATLIPVFYDMIVCEQNARANFDTVQGEMIDKLDSLVNSGKGDESFQKTFYDM